MEYAGMDMTYTDSKSVPKSTEDAKLASIWDRFLAFFIDAIVLVVPCIVLQFTVPFVLPLIVKFLYYPIFHASPLQATIGKKVMGIRVSDTQGKRLTLANAFLRELVATASQLCLLVGHFFAFFTEDRQALHDLAAGSIVVKEEVPEISLWEAWSSTMRSLIDSLSAKASGTSNVGDQISELERLNDLRQKGAISEEEYQRLKAKLL